MKISIFFYEVITILYNNVSFIQNTKQSMMNPMHISKYIIFPISKKILPSIDQEDLTYLLL